MRTLFFLVGLLVPAVASARPDWSYVQGDINVGGNHRDDGRPETPDQVGFGSLYLGTAVPLEPTKHAFAGVGVEGTVDGSNGPYQSSVGAGTRLGVVWRFNEGPAGNLPDLYVYGRVTPFIGFRSVASEEYLGENPEVTRRGQGVRLGVGFTVPAWTAIVYPAIFGTSWNSPSSCTIPDIDFSGGGEAAAIGCIAAVAVLLLNHGELTYELYSEAGQPTISRVGWRVGLGF